MVFVSKSKMDMELIKYFVNEIKIEMSILKQK